MRAQLFALCLLAALPLLFPAGCGSDDAPGGTALTINSSGQGGSTVGSGGAAGAPGTGGEQASGGDAAGGQTGGPSCYGVYTYECATCMEALCCQQVADCVANNTCIDCLFNYEASCDEPPVANLLAEVFGCSQQYCKDSCFAPVVPYSCNPVSNAPCDAGAGFSCTADWINNAFNCQGLSGTKQLCEVCGPVDGWCSPTYSCIGSQCVKNCCDNGDCGTSGSCDKSAFATIGGGEVGLCMDTGSPQQPACGDVPATAPSGGSCVPYSSGQGGSP